MIKRLFVTGVPVTGNDFTGRKEELRAIRHSLQNGQGVVLIAPRRFGKTSLILTILQGLQKSGSYVADVDLFTVLNRKRFAEYGLLYWLMKQINISNKIIRHQRPPAFVHYFLFRR